ncbi:Bifunctional homocysteine S-methyltransferase/5,10-methylenetetrahydrofolate reductase [Anaerohalosphaera lusitana]|uniref:Bifunctional homocysteine S-methyltransferase/5,10-methylenetetrahydrofolate reductase n=1 Tax=Anaerohalosphaera lusitana TaxID=1936003 RepID=A0A1U9NL55_9BACT|nr:homocysteine S-methyltransferase family protein [Anaerohalosphaera lusitana]AQT68672.1 Bifunctional homocysteine S-methyltransferase/5,10-methylenetetrahydrofolate reductase [Anaerohalosphaera lusitana]
MSERKLLERINEGVFFIDGAMGTELMARGAKMGECNDHLNVTEEGSAIVKAVHASYLAAGSDAVITNTFGANAITLKRHGYADLAGKISEAGAKIAREAADAAGGDRFVFGDIGPCGDFLEPLGMLKRDELLAAFREQAKGLADGGADAIIIETMTAVEEIEVAVEAAKSVCDLPVFASLAYDPAGEEYRTMMGIDAAAAVDRLGNTGVSGIGFNCGTLDMEGYVGLAKAYADAIGDKGLVLLAEPNAGKPELVEDKAIYSLSPDDFAAAGEKIKAVGAGIMGGCCGTSPAHIEALVKKLRG